MRRFFGVSGRPSVRSAAHGFAATHRAPAGRVSATAVLSGALRPGGMAERARGIARHARRRVRRPDESPGTFRCAGRGSARGVTGGRSGQDQRYSLTAPPVTVTVPCGVTASFQTV